MSNKIEKKEEQLKRAFEQAISRTQDAIERNQDALKDAKALIENLIEEGKRLAEEKAQHITDYNEFLETL